MIKLKKKLINSWLATTVVPRESYSNFHDLHIDEVIIGEVTKDQWIPLSVKLLDFIQKTLESTPGSDTVRAFLIIPLKTTKVRKSMVLTISGLTRELDITPPSIYLFRKNGFPITDLKPIKLEGKTESLGQHQLFMVQTKIPAGGWQQYVVVL